MPRLIYLSYPVRDLICPPAWVAALKDDPYAKASEWCFFDPGIQLQDQLDDIMVSILTNRRRSDLPFDDEKVKNRLLRASNTAYSSEIDFLHSYMLSRSDVVVADINEPNYGHVAMDVSNAQSHHVPVIGLLYKYTMDPLIQPKLSVIVSQPSTKEIVRQVVAFTLVEFGIFAKGNPDVRTDMQKGITGDYSPS